MFCLYQDQIFGDFFLCHEYHDKAFAWDDGGCRTAGLRLGDWESLLERLQKESDYGCGEDVSVLHYSLPEFRTILFRTCITRKTKVKHVAILSLKT